MGTEQWVNVFVYNISVYVVTVVTWQIKAGRDKTCLFYL